MKRKILDICLNIAIRNLPNNTEPYCHYTFLVQRNSIVEWGKNRRGPPLTFLGYESHTKMHSEVDAYFKAKGIMIKNEPFEAVNIRLTKTGSIKNSCPCKCCLAFLKGLKCKRVWFTTDLENFARMDF